MKPEADDAAADVPLRPEVWAAASGGTIALALTLPVPASDSELREYTADETREGSGPDAPVEAA